MTDTPTTRHAATPRRRKGPLIAAIAVVVLLVAGVGWFTYANRAFLFADAAPDTTPSASATVAPTRSPTPAATASPTSLPSPTVTVVLRRVAQQQLSGPEPARRPVLQDGGDATKFGVDTLLYLQSLAKRGELPVRPLEYAVITPGNPVLCDSKAEPSTIDGTLLGSQRQGIKWCPDIKALAVVPVALANVGTDDLFIDLTMAAYGSALAVANGLGTPYFGVVHADDAYSSCYHGVLMRQRVLLGLSFVAAGNSLYGYYAGSSADEALHGFVTGKCLDLKR